MRNKYEAYNKEYYSITAVIPDHLNFSKNDNVYCDWAKWVASQLSVNSLNYVIEDGNFTLEYIQACKDELADRIILGSSDE